MSNDGRDVETRFGGPRGNQINVGGLPGRPKGSSILGPLFRKLAEGACEENGWEGTRAQELAQRAIDGALTGEDITAILKLMERTDGAVEKAQTVTLNDVREGIELHDRRPAKP